MPLAGIRRINRTQIGDLQYNASWISRFWASAMKCIVFRCSKKQEMYLYVPYLDSEEAVIEKLPDGLTKLTGQIERVMELELGPDRKLARVERDDVIDAIVNKGFYLQMPPANILKNDTSILDMPSDTF